MSLSTLSVRALVAAAVAAVVAGPAAAAPRVMTQNLYLGADLVPAIQAAIACSSVPAPADCPARALLANEAAWAQVRATDFPARAQALARVIDVADPLVIGLQEVALWRSGPFDPFTPAMTVEYDFLAILLAELNARGLHYAPVSQQQEGDLEAPIGLPPAIRDIRLTLRDVVLARTDLPRALFSVSNPLGANYATNVVVPTLTGPISFTRGWASIDVRILGLPALRFVTTHLERIHDGVRRAQAAELTTTAALTSSLPIVLGGDLNSDPTGAIPDAGPGAYAVLIGSGFAAVATASETCCHAADLLDPPPAAFTEQIDHILVRPGTFGGLLAASVVGADAADRAASGAGLLWPSDHAGLVAEVRWP
jgi:hypothetical protein